MLRRRIPALLFVFLVVIGSAHAAIWPFSSTKWQWSATSIQFGKHRVGQPYTPQIVTLSNTGSTILTVNLSSVTAPFGAQGPMPSFQLQPKATADFQVEFYPPSTGDYSGQIQIQVNKTTETITVAGSGI